MNTAVIDLAIYDAFRYRDIKTYSGVARLDATYNFKKKYHIIEERYVTYTELEVTFKTEQAKTWFLINLP